MDYRQAVEAAAGALQRGEDENWRLAELTYLNTNRKGERRPSAVTHEKWAKDVRKESGRKFTEGTSKEYAMMWRDKLSGKITTEEWTAAWYERRPRDTHEKVAERGADYTAKKGDAQAAARAVKIALDRPEVADIVIADDDANRAVTNARVRHHDEARAVGEIKDPERRDARHATEHAEVMYELVKVRNWLFRSTESAREWNWTPELREEFTDTLDGLQGALDAFRSVPNFDQELSDLLEGDNR